MRQHQFRSMSSIVWAFMCVFLLVGGTAYAHDQERGRDQVSIHKARTLPLGTTVTVEGVVTVQSGAFQPNDGGFAIQHGGSGLYVHSSLDQSVELGQRVRVTGTLSNNFGEVLGVDPTSITVLDRDGRVHAHRIKTGKVSEATEGRLVEIKGTIVSEIIDDAPYGWKFNVDDGTGYVTVFVYTGTNIDVSALAQGQKVRITGFSGQFIDHYEVNPRVQSDIEVINR